MWLNIQTEYVHIYVFACEYIYTVHISVSVYYIDMRVMGAHMYTL